MADQPTQAEWEAALFHKMDTCRWLVQYEEHGKQKETCHHLRYKPTGEWNWHMEDCDGCTLWKLRVDEKQRRLF